MADATGAAAGFALGPAEGATTPNCGAAFRPPIAVATPRKAMSSRAAATSSFHGSIVRRAGRTAAALRAERTRAGGSTYAIARSPAASDRYAAFND